MSVRTALAGYLSAPADWRRQRACTGASQSRTAEWHSAMALTALARWVRGLPEDDQRLVMLGSLGCYVGDYDEFWPDEQACALASDYGLAEACFPSRWLDAFTAACAREWANGLQPSTPCAWPAGPDSTHHRPCT